MEHTFLGKCYAFEDLPAKYKPQPNDITMLRRQASIIAYHLHLGLDPMTLPMDRFNSCIRDLNRMLGEDDELFTGEGWEATRPWVERMMRKDAAEGRFDTKSAGSFSTAGNTLMG